MNLDLNNVQTPGLIRELSQIVQNDRYPLSPRIVTLKEILAQLRPEPERKAPAPATTLRAAAGGDRGENRHSSTSRKSASPREDRGVAGMAYAEIGNLALDLAAYQARLSDPAWPGTGLWPPQVGSTARQRRGSLHQLAGLGSLVLVAEFLHPGAVAAKSSAARGRFTALPPVRLIEF